LCAKSALIAIPSEEKICIVVYWDRMDSSGLKKAALRAG